MNKDQLVDIVREKANVPRKLAEAIIDGALGAITDALKKGEPVAISGFGAFGVVKRASRAGVNPRTGEKITIPEMRVPKFKAGKNLKEAVK